MPGELHKLWRTRDPKGYHVEYGYSCMGYEIAGGLGAKMAAPDREVYVMVGDGSYLMMAQELVTAVQENVKLIVVLVNNHGFASIGALSETVGAQRFGTYFRFRDPSRAGSMATPLPLDFAANAKSLGVTSTWRPHCRRAPGRPRRGKDGHRASPGRNRDRPLGPRPFQRLLVGCGRSRGRAPGHRRRGAQGLRGQQRPTAPVFVSN